MNTASVVQQYFQAINAADWNSIRQVWHPDGELVVVSARTRRGIDDVLDYLHTALGRFATHEDRPQRFLESDGAVTVEVEFSGVMHSGTEIEFSAVALFDVRDERITRLRSSYDSLRVFRQMQLISSAGQKSTS